MLRHCCEKRGAGTYAALFQCPETPCWVILIADDSGPATPFAAAIDPVHVTPTSQSTALCKTPNRHFTPFTRFLTSSRSTREKLDNNTHTGKSTRSEASIT